MNTYVMDSFITEEQLVLKTATHCHICEKKFRPQDKKVQNHFHPKTIEKEVHEVIEEPYMKVMTTT